MDGNEKEIANAFNEYFTGIPGELIRQLGLGQNMFDRPTYDVWVVGWGGGGSDHCLLTV